MNIFHFKKIILLIVFSFLFLSLTFFNKGFNQDPLTKYSYFLIAEGQALLSSVQTVISDPIKKYLFLLDLRSENAFLKAENQVLKAQQKIFQEALRENERLREMIDFSKKQEMNLLGSQVISYNFLARKNLLILNKGSLHGVKKFMGVLHPDGVVGFVFRVSPHSSQVITLKHLLASLPVRNRRTRRAGLLFSSLGQIGLNYWTGDLDFERINKNFKQGDVLVTIKSNQFPPGLPVGVVSSFNFSKEEPAKQKTPQVFIQPSVNFESLEGLDIMVEPL